jgi:hypothetical protein
MVPLFFVPKISQKKIFQKGLLYISLRKIPQKKKSYIGLFFSSKKISRKNFANIIMPPDWLGIRATWEGG